MLLVGNLQDGTRRASFLVSSLPEPSHQAHGIGAYLSSQDSGYILLHTKLAAANHIASLLCSAIIDNPISWSTYYTFLLLFPRCYSLEKDGFHRKSPSKEVRKYH
jgi:hypothetical protein